MTARPERYVGADFNIADASASETVIVPDDWGSAAAAQEDAEWFAAHPGVEERLRAPTQGEVATMPIGAGWRVLVIQIRPGLRLRRFLPAREDVDD